jgi:hypothetical protein
MPTLKGCKQLVKELFLNHFIYFFLPPRRFVAAARGRHSTELLSCVNLFVQHPGHSFLLGAPAIHCLDA